MGTSRPKPASSVTHSPTFLLTPYVRLSRHAVRVWKLSLSTNSEGEFSEMTKKKLRKVRRLFRDQTSPKNNALKMLLLSILE